MQLFKSGLIVLFIGAFYCTFIQAPLAIDGVYYYFKIISLAAPYIPNDRWGVVLIELPTLLIYQFFQSEMWARYAFCLSYALILPIVAALLLKITRGYDKLTFLSLISVTYVVLPGQLFFVSEAQICYQVFWILWCWIVLNPKSALVKGGPLVLLFAVLLHPASILFASVCFFTIQIIERKNEKRECFLRWWSILLLGAALLRVLTGFSEYEFSLMHEISNVPYITKFFSILFDYRTLVSVFCAFTITFVLMNYPYWFVIVMLLIIPFFWFCSALAMQDEGWLSGPGIYRINFVFIGTLFFLFTAFLLAPDKKISTQKIKNFSSLLWALNVGYSLSLAAYSNEWRSDLNTVLEHVRYKKGLCITKADLQTLPPQLDYWSLTYQLLIMGNSGTPYLLSTPECRSPDQSPLATEFKEWSYRHQKG